MPVDWLRPMKCQLAIVPLTERIECGHADRDVRRHNVKATIAPLYATAGKRK